VLFYWGGGGGGGGWGGGGGGFEGPFVHALLTRVGAGRWVGWMGRTFGS